jgi:uncharacterized protein
MRYRVTNLTRKTLLANRVIRAETFSSRFWGLMGVRHLSAGEGLLLEPCTAIHTFFMRIPIDALFLDASLEIVEVLHVLQPWKMTRIYTGARSVLELAAGTTRASGTCPGDRLTFEPAEEKNHPLRADAQLAD